jgi:hypothetical protein
MKTIIAGGRDISCSRSIELFIEACPWEITDVIYGGCRGVDCIGAEWARKKGFHPKLFEADWNKHGKIAGPIRNKAMAACADALILIWNGLSLGSESMLGFARERGLVILDIRYNGNLK